MSPTLLLSFSEADVALALGATSLLILLLVAFGRARSALKREQKASAAASERTATLDRDLQGVASLSRLLGEANDEETVAEHLVTQAIEVTGFDFASVALILDEEREARGLVCKGADVDPEWWRQVRIDLERERSAIATAAFGATPLQIHDVENSPNVNRRLADAIGAKSALFVPVGTPDRTLAVLVGATTEEQRTFSSGEIAVLQSFGAEAALAIERIRSSRALGEALERERLLGSIAYRVRSELDLDAVLRVAVSETGEALGVARCFIRLGEPGGPMPIVAEWDAPGFDPVGPEAGERLPVSNLAARERRTVAVRDVTTEAALEDPSLGGAQTLLDLGTRAVLGTPIIVFDRMIGIFGLHRAEASTWAPAEIALAEAVAHEVGLAIHTTRLLDENRRRAEQQTALLAAAHALGGDLRLETVLQRLVVELTKLLSADAADCYLHDTRRGTLRCAAVNNLDAALLKQEVPADEGVLGAALASKRGSRTVQAESEGTLAHPGYPEFATAMVAPMSWAGESRGVLGVALREPGRSFREGDSEILEAFADLASLALRNAATYEQSERRARAERGLYRIASVLGEPLSQEQTLSAVAQAAGEAFGGSYVAVLMPTGSELALAGGHELPRVVSDFLARPEALEEAPLRRTANERRTVASPTLGEDDRFGESWQALARDAGVGALLAIPVQTPRSEQSGIAVVFFEEHRLFTDEDLELAGHLADATSGALERSEQYERERRSRGLAQQLARTGASLAAQLDPAAVLEELVRQAPALLRVEACSIQALEGDELVVQAVAGADTERALGLRTPAVAGFAGEVAQARAPVAVESAGAGEGEGDPLVAAGYRSFLGVPLVGPEGTLQGVLAVYARGPRTWREEEMEALVALGSNASAVLANAELYQRVELERERSVAILANVADGIVAVDRDDLVVLWNEAAEQITGVPTSEALGRTPAQALGRELSARGGDRLISIRRGREEVWLSLTEAVMRDPAGEIAGRVFAFRDVSRERAVEQMKSDFVVAVSQELRRPLTSIYGFAETLLRRDVPFGEDERATFLGYIASEAQRLTLIVDELLDVARLESGDLAVEVAPTDVRTVVTDVVAAAESSSAVNGHRFELDLPEEPLSAAADAEKLHQVLVNLLDNAVKYSPGGGTVRVAVRASDSSVQVEVEDEGVGVPRGEEERIFSKFHRADPAGGGTGLGLFIARGLVNAMGGRIWVDPRRELGASFVFELPGVSKAVLTAAQD